MSAGGDTPVQKLVPAFALRSHTDWITSSCVWRGYIITGSYDHSAIQWDNTGQMVRKFPVLHTQSIQSMVVVNDQLWTASNDSTIRCWTWEGECLGCVSSEGAQRSICALNSMIYAGSESSMLTECSSTTVKNTRKKPMGRGAIWGLVSHGSHIWVGFTGTGNAESVVVLDHLSLEPVATIAHHVGSLARMHVSLDRIYACGDRGVEVWNPESRDSLLRLHRHEATKGRAILENSGIIWVAGTGDACHGFDALTGDLVFRAVYSDCNNNPNSTSSSSASSSSSSSSSSSTTARTVVINWGQLWIGAQDSVIRCYRLCAASSLLDAAAQYIRRHRTLFPPAHQLRQILPVEMAELIDNLGAT